MYARFQSLTKQHQLKPIQNGSHPFIILPALKVTLSRQKIKTSVETDTFTKVHQRMAMFDCLHLNWDVFYSESCLSVSDLYWKTTLLEPNTKCPLELRFLKVVGSAKLPGTPLQTWYYIYRHLLMTQDRILKGIFVFPK